MVYCGRRVKEGAGEETGGGEERKEEEKGRGEKKGGNTIDKTIILYTPL